MELHQHKQKCFFEINARNNISADLDSAKGNQHNDNFTNVITENADIFADFLVSSFNDSPLNSNFFPTLTRTRKYFSRILRKDI